MSLRAMIHSKGVEKTSTEPGIRLNMNHRAQHTRNNKDFREFDQTQICTILFYSLSISDLNKLAFKTRCCLDQIQVPRQGQAPCLV